MPILKNARHELFAQEIAKGATQDAAFILAGFKENRGNASSLRAKPLVTQRILELQAVAAEETICTVQDIARQLDEDRAFAKECEVPSACVAATMGKAKVLGLMIEKHEHTGKDGEPLAPVMDDKEIARLAVFLLTKASKES